MPALSVLGASWRLKPEERNLLIGTYIPWAMHAGSRSADLMCLYYERHFEVRIYPLRLRITSTVGKFCLLPATSHGRHLTNAHAFNIRQYSQIQ